MTILRWIVFLPCLIITTALMQFFGGIAGEAGPWWIWVPLYMFFGWTITYYLTARVAYVCPNTKVGGLMFLGFFIVLEPIAFISTFGDSTAAANIIRFGNDLSILMGILASMAIKPEDINR